MNRRDLRETANDFFQVAANGLRCEIGEALEFTFSQVNLKMWQSIPQTEAVSIAWAN